MIKLKIIALLEIILICSMSFSFSHFLNEYNGKSSSESNLSVYEWIVNKLFENNIVSAFDLSSLANMNIPDLTGGSKSICLESIEGKICQTTDSETCQQVCKPGKCIEVSSGLSGSTNVPEECKLGSCQDQEHGICALNAPKEACEDDGGKWFDDPNGNVAECKKGCCILGQTTEFTTELACQKKVESRGYDFGAPDAYFDPALNAETSCLLSAVGEAEGACVFGMSEEEALHECTRLTQTECANLGGVFSEGWLCSKSDLETVCTPKNYTSCLDGFDEVYWFDSCGNVENIFGSAISGKEGMILTKQESCKIGSSGNWLQNQENCGNCNRLTSSMCGNETNGEELEDTPDGGIVCRDLGCEDVGRRENGETWCAYQSNFGVFPEGAEGLGPVSWLPAATGFGGSFGGGLMGTRSVGPPGSGFFRKSCIDGEVEITSCVPYRNEICEEDRGGDEGEPAFTIATCRTNRWQECVNYNPPDKGEGIAGTVKVVSAMASCEIDPDCFVKTIDVGKDFKFPVCLPKYPPGFLLGMGEENGGEICGFASQTCSAVFLKKARAMGFGGAYWECQANCDCIEGDTPESAQPSQKFVTEMSDFCSSLGDCGMKVNYLGASGGSQSLQFKKCVTDDLEGECKDKKPASSSSALSSLTQMADIEAPDGKFIQSDPEALEASIGGSTSGPFSFLENLDSLMGFDSGGAVSGLQGLGSTEGGGPLVGGQIPSAEGYQGKELPWVGGIIGASGLGLGLAAHKGWIPGLATKAVGVATPATTATSLTPVAEGGFGLQGPIGELPAPAGGEFSFSLGSSSSSVLAPGVESTAASAASIEGLSIPASLTSMPETLSMGVVNPATGAVVNVPAGYLVTAEGAQEGVIVTASQFGDVVIPATSSVDIVPVALGPNGALQEVSGSQALALAAQQPVTTSSTATTTTTVTSTVPQTTAHMFSPTAAAFGNAMMGAGIAGAVASLVIAFSGIAPGIGEGGTWGLTGGAMAGGGLVGAGMSASVPAGSAIPASGAGLVAGSQPVSVTAGSVSFTTAGGGAGTAAAGEAIPAGATGVVAAEPGTTVGPGLSTAANPALLAVGIVVLVIVFTMIILNIILGVGEMKRVDVSSECKPWTPPLGGGSCEDCGTDEFPCNAYACSALGATCGLIGEEPHTVCVNNNPNDISGPVITPIEANISEGYEITEDRETGFEIIKSGSDPCLEEFDRVKFSVETDEYSQCKISLDGTQSFEEMEFFSGTNYFSKSHEHEIDSLWIFEHFANLGNPFADEEQRTVNLYILCQDGTGNPSREHSVQVCVIKRDSTPPLLTSITPQEIILPYNATRTTVRIRSNEPAVLAWSEEDKEFDEMDGLSFCPTNGGITDCSMEIPIDKDETTIYIRGKDHPDWVGTEREDERHANQQSVVVVIRRVGSALEIISISPNEDMTTGTPAASVNIEVTTSGGYSDGAARCRFSIDRESEIEFAETGGSLHRQLIERFAAGRHTISVICADVIGNAATAQTSFRIEKDLSWPTVARVYKEGGNLVVITEEPAVCAFVTQPIGASKTSCGFDVDDTEKMTSSVSDRVHMTALDSSLTYFVRCKDVYGNIKGGCSITVAEGNL